MRRLPARHLQSFLLLGALGSLAACRSHLIRYPQSAPEPACPRGRPHAILSRANPDLFGLLFHEEAGGQASETARLAGGIPVLIRHARCGPVTTEFVFELRGSSPSVEARGQWYARGAELLELLAAGSPEAEGLRIMARRLQESSAEAPPYDAALPLDDFQTISLRAVQKIRPERVHLEIRYAIKV